MMNPELGVLAKDLVREKMTRFERLSRMDMVLATLLKETNEAERAVDGRWLKSATLAQVLIRTSIFALLQDIERLDSEPDKERARNGVQATRLFIERGVVVSANLTPSPQDYQDFGNLRSHLTAIDYANDPIMRGREF